MDGAAPGVVRQPPGLEADRPGHVHGHGAGPDALGQLDPTAEQRHGCDQCLPEEDERDHPGGVVPTKAGPLVPYLEQYVGTDDPENGVGERPGGGRGPIAGIAAGAASGNGQVGGEVGCHRESVWWGSGGPPAPDV